MPRFRWSPDLSRFAIVTVTVAATAILLSDPAHAVKRKAAPKAASGPVTIRMDVDLKGVRNESGSTQTDTFRVVGDYRVASFPTYAGRSVPWVATTAVATATHLTDEPCFHTESSGTGVPSLGPNDGVQFYQVSGTGKKYMFAWLGSIAGVYTASTARSDCVQRIPVGQPTSFTQSFFNENDFPGCDPAVRFPGLRLNQSTKNPNVYLLECSADVPNAGGSPTHVTVRMVATVTGTPKFQNASQGG